MHSGGERDAYMMPAWGIMAGILNLEPGDSLGTVAE